MTEPTGTTGTTDPPEPVLDVRDEARVRVLTFNRPGARNAFDLALYSALTAALHEALADDGVHAVVVTGAGTAFSAGQDLREMTALATGTAPEGAEQGFQNLLEVVQSFDKPLIAAVNGFGVGWGFTMLGHCDIVFMADTARLKVPFAELAVAPEAGSSYLFPQRFGWMRAAHILLSSDWVSAEQALDWGIAFELCPPDDLLPTTLAYAQRIASASLDSLRAIKGLMLAAHLPEIRQARQREEEAFATLLFSATTRDALDQFTGGTP